nr:hypothetical protein [Micromonospora sp. DSM 115978]
AIAALAADDGSAEPAAEIAAVVLDGMLPDVPARAVVEAAGARRRPVPVVMVSGLDAEDLPSPDAYVAKPFRPPQLEAAVDAVTGRHPDGETAVQNAGPSVDQELLREETNRDDGDPTVGA